MSYTKAYQLIDRAEGIRFYKDSIRSLNADPENAQVKREKLKICLSLLSPMHILGYPDGALEILLDAERLALELEDKRTLTMISGRLGYYYTVKGNPLLGLWYSEQCLHGQEKNCRSITSIVEISRNLCAAFWFTGNYAKVVEIARRALAIIEKHRKKKDLFADGVNAYSSLISWSGSALGWLGEFRKGKTLLDEGLRNALEVNDRFEAGFIELMYSTLLYWQGDGRRTVEYAGKAVSYFEETGADILLGTARMMLGAGKYLLGDSETALKHAEEGLRTQTLPINLPWNYWHLGMILSAAGDQGQAERNIREALRLSQELNTRACEGASWIALGSIAGKTFPDHEDAERFMGQGLSLLREQKLKALVSFGHLFLGEMLAGKGRRHDCLKNLNEAMAMFQKMALRPGHYWLDRAQTGLKKNARPLLI